MTRGLVDAQVKNGRERGEEEPQLGDKRGGEHEQRGGGGRERG